MNTENVDKIEKTPRRRWGRRRSDWMIPLILLAVAILIALWAIDNYSKVQELQRINDTLDVQAALLERLLKHGDQERVQTPAPVPAPVAPAPAAPAPVVPNQPMATETMPAAGPTATSTRPGVPAPLATSSTAPVPTGPIPSPMP